MLLAGIMSASGSSGVGFSFRRMLCGPSWQFMKNPTPWPVP